MGKHLVIVESPAKAKTIHKFLGKDYEVRASMGHVRDLPKTKFGIDIEKDFTPQYTSIPSRSSLIKELASIVKKVDTVFLATDLDREGEAIAWHLAEALKVPKPKLRRVVFNEITKKAITNAFKQAATALHMDKVCAQQARRILDRIFGYQLSPLLWKKITKGLSAGRVQSVAVKLIVEKEKEILAFASEEYWKITAQLATKENKEFKAEFKKKSKTAINNEKQAQKIVDGLKKASFEVSDVVSKNKSENPPPPFTTSLLQQQASIRLRLSAKKTMMIAQQLYEGLDVGNGPVGLITYMRTDSVRVADEALDECREYIKDNFDPEYLPKKARVFPEKKAQAAHEAIRPTSVLRTPEDAQSHLTKDQYRLYKLIWDRFVACQLAAARYAFTNIKIQAAKHVFEAKGKQILFPGYLAVTAKESKEGEEKKDVLLPPLAKNEVLDLKKLEPTQHFTQPPPRYTEATLVKALESKGIGRPSTYAPIISTVQDRGYVVLKDRKFNATDLGIKVTEKLVDHFSQFIDTDFTSQMETKLDKIEEKTIDWVEVLKEFYGSFQKDLENAYQKMDSLKENPEVSEHSCDKCKSPLIYKYNKHGKFLGCSAFPDCKNTIPLDSEGKPFFPQVTKHECPQCSKPLILRQGRLGKFFGCSAYPDCKTTLGINDNGEPAIPEKTDQKCEICNAGMVIKQGPRGNFLACSNYPECKNAKPLSGEKSESLLNKVITTSAKCEKCNKEMALKKGRRGVFLGCTGYPKCRNLQKFKADSINLPPELKDRTCEKCQSPIVLRNSFKGLFLGCPGYPECDYTTSVEELLLASQTSGGNT